jgi:hypothetical protein
MAKEASLNEKAQYYQPPCANQFRLTSFYVENSFYLC